MLGKRAAAILRKHSLNAEMMETGILDNGLRSEKDPKLIMKFLQMLLYGA